MRACDFLSLDRHRRVYTTVGAPRVGSANTARHAPWPTRSAASCCSRAQGGLSGSAVSMGPQRRRPGCRWRGRPPRSDGASTRRAFQPSATTRTASHTADATLNVNTASVAAVDAAVAASATLSITLTVATTASSDRLLVLPACMARARGTVAAAAMDGAGRAARRRGRGIPRAGLPLGCRGGPCATPRARTDGAGRGA